MPSKYARTKQEHISDEELLAEKPKSTYWTDKEERVKNGTGSKQDIDDIEYVKMASEPLTFDVQEAPEGIFDVKPKTNLLDDVLNKIGVGPGEKRPTEKIAEEFKHPVDLHLSSKQEKWCKDATPMAISVVGILGNAWGLLGEDYKLLAPDYEMKLKIVAPLVRIYARTVKTLDIINPNYLDAAASISAAIDYSISCYNTLKIIWAYQRGEIDHELRSTGNGTDKRHENGEANTVFPNNASNHNGNSDGKNAHRNARNGATTSGQLTPEQEYQRQQLARLSALDAQGRARRWGYTGNV